jgi:hypothetical protein
VQVGEVRLPVLLALDADVEADELDVVLSNELRRQV